MILDARTFEQVAAVDESCAASRAESCPARSRPSSSPRSSRRTRVSVRRPRRSTSRCSALRRAAASAAEAEGLAIAAAGTHPFALPEAQPIVKEERYVTFVGYGGISRAPPGRAGAARARRHALGRRVLALPRGDRPVASGRARAVGELAVVRRRAERDGVESRPDPRRAAARRRAAGVRARTREWEAWVERLVRLGVTEDYTRIWWDVRPHPKLGTLEVRIADQPTDVRLSAAFAALLQALCATALAGGLPARQRLARRPRARRLRQNRWSAARFGPRAELLHPDGTQLRPGGRARGRAARARRARRPRLGGAELLDAPRPGVCEADLQLEHESPQAAAADLVVRSLG